MKKVLLFLLLVLILAHTSGGCTAKKESAKSSETEGKVVARVNGTPITEEDLSFRLAGPHGEKRASGNQQKALDDVITEESLYQQGLKIGLDKDPKYQAQIARFERQLTHVKRAEMRRRVYNTQVAAKVEVTQVDAKNYYDKNVDRITTELHLGVIPFNNREAAGKLWGRSGAGQPLNPSPGALWGARCRPGGSPGTWGSYPGNKFPLTLLKRFID